MTVPIKIDNANISGEGGSISNATITGDATIERSTEGGEHPEHPILLPPTSDNPDVFYVLVYFPPTEEGGDGHWEWVAFLPGSPPERPHPQPPEPPEIGEGIEEKPFPPDGGWGYKEPYGWIYWPGPGGAGPKRRK